MGKKQAFLQAARNGDALAISRMLNSNPSGVSAMTAKVGKVAHKVGVKVVPLINKSDENGATALHLSALEGHLDVVKMLLNNGAQIGVLDNRNCTVLHYACHRGRTAVVTELLMFAKANQTASASAPSHAASYEPSHRSNNRVSSFGHSSALLDMNAQNADGETALHVAATFNHARCVALLLEHGTNPLLLSQIGETPLDVAVRNGHVDSVRHLASYIPSAVKRIRRVTGQSTIHEATKRGEIKTLRALLEAGFEVNAANDFGTALHIAALCHRTDAFALILATGSCDLEIRDSKEKNVRDLLNEMQSTAGKHDSVSEMLRILDGGVEVARRRVAELPDEEFDVTDGAHTESEKPPAVAARSQPGTRPPRPATMATVSRIVTDESQDRQSQSAVLQTLQESEEHVVKDDSKPPPIVPKARHTKARVATETDSAANKNIPSPSSDGAEALATLKLTEQADDQLTLQPQLPQRSNLRPKRHPERQQPQPQLPTQPQLQSEQTIIQLQTETQPILQSEQYFNPVVGSPPVSSAMRDLEDVFGAGPSGTSLATAVLQPFVTEPKTPSSPGTLSFTPFTSASPAAPSAPVSVISQSTSLGNVPVSEEEVYAVPVVPSRCPPPPTGPKYAHNRVGHHPHSPPLPPKMSPNSSLPSSPNSTSLSKRFPFIKELVSMSTSTRITAGDIVSELRQSSAAKTWYASEQASLFGWLSQFGLECHEDAFLAAGYNSLHFINGAFDAKDLSSTLPSVTASHSEPLLRSAARLPDVINKLHNRVYSTLTEWLEALELDSLYSDTFVAAGYSTVQQCLTLWPTDLARIGVRLHGHRRRLVESLYAQKQLAKSSGPASQTEPKWTAARRLWWPLEPLVLVHGYYPFPVFFISVHEDNGVEENICKPALLYLNCKKLKYFDASDSAIANNQSKSWVLLKEHSVIAITKFMVAETSATQTQLEAMAYAKMHCGIICTYRITQESKTHSETKPHQCIANTTFKIGAASPDQFMKVAKIVAEAYDISEILFGSA